MIIFFFSGFRLFERQKKRNHRGLWELLKHICHYLLTKPSNKQKVRWLWVAALQCGLFLFPSSHIQSPLSTRGHWTPFNQPVLIPGRQDSTEHSRAAHLHSLTQSERKETEMKHERMDQIFRTIPRSYSLLSCKPIGGCCVVCDTISFYV